MASSSSATESLSLQLLDAIADGDEAKAASLIEQGADVNFIDPTTGSNCFSLAFDNVGMVKLLLAKGADPNRRDGEGDRPLLHVIGTGNIEIVKALIDGGADVNQRTGLLGETLVNEAFLEQDTEILKYLVQRGADTNNRSWVANKSLGELAQEHEVSKQQLADMIGYELSKSSWFDSLLKAIRLR